MPALGYHHDRVAVFSFKIFRKTLAEFGNTNRDFENEEFFGTASDITF